MKFKYSNKTNHLTGIISPNFSGSQKENLTNLIDYVTENNYSGLTITCKEVTELVSIHRDLRDILIRSKKFHHTSGEKVYVEGEEFLVLEVLFFGNRSAMLKITLKINCKYLKITKEDIGKPEVYNLKFFYNNYYSFGT